MELHVMYVTSYCLFSKNIGRSSSNVKELFQNGNFGPIYFPFESGPESSFLNVIITWEGQIKWTKIEFSYLLHMAGTPSNTFWEQKIRHYLLRLNFSWNNWPYIDVWQMVLRLNSNFRIFVLTYFSVIDNSRINQNASFMEIFFKLSFWCWHFDIEQTSINFSSLKDIILNQSSTSRPNLWTKKFDRAKIKNVCRTLSIFLSSSNRSWSKDKMIVVISNPGIFDEGFKLFLSRKNVHVKTSKIQSCICMSAPVLAYWREKCHHLRLLKHHFAADRVVPYWDNNSGIELNFKVFIFWRRLKTQVIDDFVVLKSDNLNSHFSLSRFVSWFSETVIS